MSRGSIERDRSVVVATGGGQPIAVVPARIRPPRHAAMNRDRLERRLAGALRHRLVLVVGPAGVGKTTILDQLAATSQAPVAWYRAEADDRSIGRMLLHLHAAVQAALGPVGDPWTTVADAAIALDAWPGAAAVICIDDLHTLEGTDAEVALEQLVDYLPPTIVLAAASRSLPNFNLSRLRVSGDLLELTADDLRFRSWEVERLFRDFYKEPLPPQDLAELARRTAGWAAGLQLFHLATRGKSSSERRRTITALGSRLPLVRDYLTRNVLSGLPAELRDFLLTTSVLGRLDAALCDRLRDGGGSQRLLEDLQRRQILVQPDDQGCTRYHEVLRTQLETLFMEQVGERAAQATYLRAGRILEDAGWPVDAIRAYCRGEDWAAVDRLLGQQGEEIAEGASGWMDALPQGMLRHDPWVRLAGARRHRAAGRWAEAVASYQIAEEAFGAAAAASRCSEERQVLQFWLEHGPLPQPAGSWWVLLRAGVNREPLRLLVSAARLPRREARLATGLLELLAGQLPEATTSLQAAAYGSTDDGELLGLGARIALGAALLLRGDDEGEAELEAALEESETRGQAWLSRFARAALALGSRPGGSSDAAAVAMAAEREGDEWGAALGGLVQGIAATLQGENPAEHLERVALRCRRLGAGVLEAWARAFLALALARGGAPEAREAAVQAEAFARSTGTRAMSAVAYLAMAHAEPGSEEFRNLAVEIARECGLALPAGLYAGPPVNNGPDSPPVMRIRCFGGFTVEIAGHPLDLASIKPRARALLRFFALRGGEPVHREVLQEAMWPEADTDIGARNLHVAVSALRQVLEPGVARGASEFIVRDGDAYRLTLPAGAELDIRDFERAVADGRSRRARGDLAAAADAFSLALVLHAGELLPEDGPAEWVVERRSRCRSAAAEAAQALAEISLERDDATEAVRACNAGIAIDRYDDALWRLLISGHEARGDLAATSRARAAYAELVGELDVAPEAAPV